MQTVCQTNVTNPQPGLTHHDLLNFLPCYVSVQDPTLTILFTNAKFRDDFGDAVGKPCFVAYKGRDERCELCPVQKTFEDKEPHISQETVTLSNGEEAQMVVYSAPITDSEGNINAVIEMSINITSVTEMEKELKFLGQSIALLSHDIKNMLEGLQGGAYVVDEGLKDEDFSLVRRGWDIVKRNVGDISRVTQNILYACKTRRAKLQRLSPNEIAADVVDLFREQAKCRDVDLRCELKEDLPSAYLEPSSVRRMLTNLIWNGLEACGQDKKKRGHTVTVRTDYYDKSHFAFEVEDNGIGMDEQTQKNIFRDFFSTKGSDGTGLGLMVVNRIVKQHRGQLEVHSVPGEGSIFRVVMGVCLPSRYVAHNQP